MMKNEVKEIPNQPISIHLKAHQGQWIKEAGTKTTLGSLEYHVMHLAP